MGDRKTLVLWLAERGYLYWILLLLIALAMAALIWALDHPRWGLVGFVICGAVYLAVASARYLLGRRS